MLPPEDTQDSRGSFTQTTPSKSSKKGRKDILKPVLKRVILGGLDVLHRAVCTYIALLAVDPQLSQRIDFQFFLVPLGRNDLAAFIAQRDGLYKKHVFIPFHGPLIIVPQVRSGSDSGNGEELELSEKPPTTTARSTNLAATRRTSANQITLSSTKNLFGGGGSTTFPTQFDSDFNEGGVLLEDEILDSLEDGGYSAITSDMQHKKQKIDAVPGKLLRSLLESYVRNAQHQFPSVVYDCECWESPDAIEVDRNPDITIPFCVRVEIGLWAAIAAQQSSFEFSTNFEGYSVGEGLGADASFEEILSDKTFLKSISGNASDLKITTPELVVNMYTMGIDGSLEDRFGLELADSHYLSLVVSSVPKFTFPNYFYGNTVGIESFEPSATASNPTFPWLEVQSVSAKPSLVDLVKKKDKKPKDFETIRDSMRAESKTHHIGFLDVRSTLASRVPFLIAVDGQSFGPYYRVRIRRSTALSTSGGQSSVLANSPKVFFPIMTYYPFEKGF